MEHPMLEPILNYFKQISAIPRCSGNEEGIRNWLKNWAANKNFACLIDEVGNVLIKVPGNRCGASRQAVVIQGHMDMVCEKTPDSTHNFCTDALNLYTEEGWLKAKNTTLGADNGIAIAIGLALADDESLCRPPLELFFTVEEETGLVGASGLKPGFLTGKYLLNVDSEDEGVFTIGCAGGKDTHIDFTPEFTDAESKKAFKITVGGLKGGHSGMDINQNRSNAIQLLTEFLAKNNAQLIEINGGTAHNAIPRDAYALAFVEDISFAVKAFEQTVKAEINEFEPGFFISFEEIENTAKALTKKSSSALLQLLQSLPHGVFKLTPNMADLVQTSNNLAKVYFEDGVYKILTSQRSSVINELDELTKIIEDTAVKYNAVAQSGNGYPPWQPDWNSSLLAKCKSVYKKLYNKDAVVEVIHAGLECGLIGAKYPGMQMISFGPNIRSPHSPEERLELDSIGKIWDFTVEFLHSL